MDFLYCFECVSNTDNIVSISCLESVDIFVPSLFRGMFLKGEKWTLKVFLVRCAFYLQTFGKAQIFFARSRNGKLMHTSYVIPKCFKFSFMKPGDLEIGPCFTFEEFRGQGVYPQMLRYIINYFGSEKKAFYMIVNKNNISSIQGIEKAGFVRIGNVRKNKLCGRYYLI